MNRGTFLTAAAILPSVASAQIQLVPGDVLVGSRTYGSVYGPLRGQVPYSLLTGRDLGTAALPLRGAGPELRGSAQLAVLAMSSERVLARGASPAPLGVYTVNLLTGDRTLLPGTDAALWNQSGDMVALDSDTFLALADDWDSGMSGNGKLLRYSISTGQTSLVSGGALGDGIVMHRPRSLALVDSSTAAVLEFGQGAGSSLPGTLVYLIDLLTGNRTVLSSLGTQTALRLSAMGGVVTSTPQLVPSRGDGPVSNGAGRGATVIDGRLFVALSLTNPFAGSIVEINLVTGNRTLVVGEGIVGTSRIVVDPGAGSTAALPTAPTALQRASATDMAFVATFGPESVWRLNMTTRVLTSIATLQPQIDPTLIGTVNLTGFAVVPPSGSTACYANCDASSTPPILNVADFVCFTNRYAAGDAYANCDHSTVAPSLNVGDFICYLNAFAAGCT